MPVSATSPSALPLGITSRRLVTASSSLTVWATASEITPPGGEDFEYYVEAVPTEGDAAPWPVTAPETCQTVVVTN